MEHLSLFLILIYKIDKSISIISLIGIYKLKKYKNDKWKEYNKTKDITMFILYKEKYKSKLINIYKCSSGAKPIKIT